MNRIILAAFVACPLLLLNISTAEPTKKDAETVTIPLDQIWAYKLPGTRDIQVLESEHKKLTGKALLDPISVAWAERAEKLKWKNLTRPGFAVQGKGAAALAAAKSIIVEGKNPQSSFPSTADITIVSIAEPVKGARIRPHKVSHQGGTIRIEYELDQVLGGSGRLNLALIPLGKMSKGKYRVEFTQVVSGKAPEHPIFKPMKLDPNWQRRYQCQPFEFRVTDTDAQTRKADARAEPVAHMRVSSKLASRLGETRLRGYFGRKNVGKLANRAVAGRVGRV
jgi:hypothetical protein